jgi:hypothetical protein
MRLAPVGHHERGLSLNNLANALINHFDQRGNHQDLDKAIMLHRDALDLTPVGHPDRCGSLNHLTRALSTRFDQRNDDKDIDEAIAFGREALRLMPNESVSLDSLATAPGMRFQQGGNARDINEAIVLHMEALHLVPRRRHYRYRYLSGLANTLTAVSINMRNRKTKNLHVGNARTRTPQAPESGFAVCSLLP